MHERQGPRTATATVATIAAATATRDHRAVEVAAKSNDVSSCMSDKDLVLLPPLLPPLLLLLLPEITGLLPLFELLLTVLVDVEMLLLITYGTGEMVLLLVLRLELLRMGVRA
jgi:hypothetical protein